MRIIIFIKKNGLITYNLPYNLNMTVYIIAFIQFIQIFIISVWKIIFGINKILYHKEEFEVRNSPLNRLASITSNLLYCWKIGCQVGSGGLSILGSSMLVDTALEAADHDKIFEPIITKGINSMIGSNANKDEFANITKKLKLLKSASAQHDLLTAEVESNKQSIDILVKNKVMSAEEGQMMKEGFDYLKNSSLETLKKDATSLSSEWIANINKRNGVK